jgi:Uncharacterised protein family (UPF0158)
MNYTQLFDAILSMVQTIKDNPVKLQKLHDFIVNEIYDEHEQDEEYDEDDGVSQVPEKYQAVVKEAAGWLASDMVCFINAETLELVTIPSGVMDEIGWEEPEADEEVEAEEKELRFDDYDVFRKDLKRITAAWKEVIRIGQPESHESFLFMKRFTHNVSDARLQNVLVNALDRAKPFRNFNAIIHNSSAREAWFNFRQKCLEKYVFDEIRSELNDDSTA